MKVWERFSADMFTESIYAVIAWLLVALVVFVVRRPRGDVRSRTSPMLMVLFAMVLGVAWCLARWGIFLINWRAGQQLSENQTLAAAMGLALGAGIAIAIAERPR